MTSFFKYEDVANIFLRAPIETGIKQEQSTKHTVAGMNQSVKGLCAGRGSDC